MFPVVTSYNEMISPKFLRTSRAEYKKHENKRCSIDFVFLRLKRKTYINFQQMEFSRKLYMKITTIKANITSLNESQMLMKK